jgi:hypothetical protein
MGRERFSEGCQHIRDATRSDGRGEVSDILARTVVELDVVESQESRSR